MSANFTTETTKKTTAVYTEPRNLTPACSSNTSSQSQTVPLVGSWGPDRYLLAMQNAGRSSELGRLSKECRRELPPISEGELWKKLCSSLGEEGEIFPKQGAYTHPTDGSQFRIKRSITALLQRYRKLLGVPDGKLPPRLIGGMVRYLLGMAYYAERFEEDLLPGQKLCDYASPYLLRSWKQAPRDADVRQPLVGREVFVAIPVERCKGLMATLLAEPLLESYGEDFKKRFTNDSTALRHCETVIRSSATFNKYCHTQKAGISYAIAAFGSFMDGVELELMPVFSLREHLFHRDNLRMLCHLPTDKDPMSFSFECDGEYSPLQAISDEIAMVIHCDHVFGLDATAWAVAMTLLAKGYRTIKPGLMDELFGLVLSHRGRRLPADLAERMAKLLQYGASNHGKASLRVAAMALQACFDLKDQSLAKRVWKHCEQKLDKTSCPLTNALVSELQSGELPIAVLSAQLQVLTAFQALGGSESCHISLHDGKPALRVSLGDDEEGSVLWLKLNLDQALDKMTPYCGDEAFLRSWNALISCFSRRPTSSPLSAKDREALGFSPGLWNDRVLELLRSSKPTVQAYGNDLAALLYSTDGLTSVCLNPLLEQFPKDLARSSQKEDRSFFLQRILHLLGDSDATSLAMDLSSSQSAAEWSQTCVTPFFCSKHPQLHTYASRWFEEWRAGTKPGETVHALSQLIPLAFPDRCGRALDMLKRLSKLGQGHCLHLLRAWVDGTVNAKAFGNPYLDDVIQLLAPELRQAFVLLRREISEEATLDCFSKQLATKGCSVGSLYRGAVSQFMDLGRLDIAQELVSDLPDCKDMERQGILRALLGKLLQQGRLKEAFRLMQTHGIDRPSDWLDYAKACAGVVDPQQRQEAWALFLELEYQSDYEAGYLLYLKDTELVRDEELEGYIHHAGPLGSLISKLSKGAQEEVHAALLKAYMTRRLKDEPASWRNYADFRRELGPSKAYTSIDLSLADRAAELSTPWAWQQAIELASAISPPALQSLEEQFASVLEKGWPCEPNEAFLKLIATLSSIQSPIKTHAITLYKSYLAHGHSELRQGRSETHAAIIDGLIDGELGYDYLRFAESFIWDGRATLPQDARDKLCIKLLRQYLKLAGKTTSPQAKKLATQYFFTYTPILTKLPESEQEEIWTMAWPVLDSPSEGNARQFFATLASNTTSTQERVDALSYVASQITQWGAKDPSRGREAHLWANYVLMHLCETPLLAHAKLAIYNLFFQLALLVDHSNQGDDCLEASYNTMKKAGILSTLPPLLSDTILVFMDDLVDVPPLRYYLALKTLQQRLMQPEAPAPRVYSYVLFRTAARLHEHLCSQSSADYAELYAFWTCFSAALSDLIDHKGINKGDSQTLCHVATYAAKLLDLLSKYLVGDKVAEAHMELSERCINFLLSGLDTKQNPHWQRDTRSCQTLGLAAGMLIIGAGTERTPAFKNYYLRMATRILARAQEVQAKIDVFLPSLYLLVPPEKHSADLKIPAAELKKLKTRWTHLLQDHYRQKTKQRSVRQAAYLRAHQVWSPIALQGTQSRACSSSGSSDDLSKLPHTELKRLLDKYYESSSTGSNAGSSSTTSSVSTAQSRDLVVALLRMAKESPYACQRRLGDDIGTKLPVIMDNHRILDGDLWLQLVDYVLSYGGKAAQGAFVQYFAFRDGGSLNGLLGESAREARAAIWVKILQKQAGASLLTPQIEDCLKPEESILHATFLHPEVEKETGARGLALTLWRAAQVAERSKRQSGESSVPIDKLKAARERYASLLGLAAAKQVTGRLDGILQRIG